MTRFIPEAAGAAMGKVSRLALHKETVMQLAGNESGEEMGKVLTRGHTCRGHSCTRCPTCQIWATGCCPLPTLFC